MRIVSLLPSATEILCRLGLRESLVGVSHECDWPSDVVGLPVLTQAKIDASRTSAEISRDVGELALAGLGVYRIDEERLQQLRPDFIVTQDTCEVCAVALDDVCQAARRIVGADVQVVSLSPSTVAEVFASIERVGDATGVTECARDVVAELSERLAALAMLTAPLPRPRVLLLEWLDPPMAAGHWTPELLRLAGGEPVACHDGLPTRATNWRALAATEPEAILVAPCGFPIEQTLGDLQTFSAVREFSELAAVRAGRVHVIDGNAYFNRPGPRLVESAELAAKALHGARLELDVPPGGMLHWGAA